MDKLSNVFLKLRLDKEEDALRSFINYKELELLLGTKFLFYKLN